MPYIIIKKFLLFSCLFEQKCVFLQRKYAIYKGE